MIIARIMGGLGNQMFQYAAGRRLAHHLGCPLKLDLNWFSMEASRVYGLKAFNIQEDLPTHEEIIALTKTEHPVIPSFVYNILREFTSLFPPLVLEGHGTTFMPGLLKAPDNVYLDGYWQAEQYFADISSMIREEFTLKQDILRLYEPLPQEIEDSCSISIHIRRGDYETNPAVRKKMGYCGLDYYQRAIAHCLEKFDNPNFFVFSDDIAWAKENLDIRQTVTFISDPLIPPQDDMRLMSLCRHHIIANSSFSWWAAWLNPRADKMVIAPKKWYAESTEDSDVLLSDNWITL